MFRLCCRVIGSSAGRLQQMAANALLDTAASASGEEGCASAQNSDIDALMEALQSPEAAVREAVLRVGGKVMVLTHQVAKC